MQDNFLKKHFFRKKTLYIQFKLVLSQHENERD